MADFIESARGILSHSQSRMEAAANNVANLTTPGFKTERLYSDVSAETGPRVPEQLLLKRFDLAQGHLASTGNPLDLAIAGPGMFRLRGADGSFAYSRSGQFRIADDGRIVNAQGLVLQGADGDVAVPGPQVRLLPDGTLMDGARPVAKVALYAPAPGASLTARGGSMFTVAGDNVDEVRSPELRQGMLETSNVSVADEMVGMMDALRAAEGGARLVQTYDDLMGRAISTLGQGIK